MKKIFNKNKSYKGMGFAEVLIAIMVTGIASVVLMSISASSIRSMLTTDTIDAMSQYARSGSVIVQQIADNDDTVFPTLMDGQCYALDYDGGTNSYSIDTNSSGLYGDRSTYKGFVLVDSANSEAQEIFFRTICLDEVVSSTSSPNVRAIIKVIVGGLNYDGLLTNDTDIKDYEYTAVIDL